MITRHNYEEYFILYMDNELSSHDRRLVEAFVQQHPDLKDELDSLLQYKLVPDIDIVFAGKEALLKTGGLTTITLSNYDEWLVLYIDNELTEAQKITVDQFIAAHPSLIQELALLQRSKLQPEEIIFAHKASLYREEEKVRPMPSPRRWRLAAAAVLLLGAGITTAILVNKKSSVGDSETKIVKGTLTEKKDNTTIPVITPKESNSPVNENSIADNTNSVITPVVKQTPVNTVAVKVKDNTAKKQSPVINPPEKEEVAVTNNKDKKTNDLPQPVYNPNVNKQDANNNAVANTTIPKELKQKDPLTNPVVTTNTPQSSDIVYASNKTDAADFDQPNDKKNKSRGLFRKIARTFEKRTNIDPTDDNKLLVAGLSIKLK